MKTVKEIVVGGVGMKRCSTGDFQHCENTLYDTTIQTSVIVHLYKLKECTTTSSLNLMQAIDFGMTMVCQCRLSDFNKRTTIVGIIDNGEATHVKTDDTFLLILLKTYNCS